MKPYKVPREVWAFDEVREKLGISERDLKRMVMDGTIRPTMLFSRELHPVTMQDGVPVAQSQEPVAFRGWLWAAQEQADQFDNFNCLYPLWRNSPFHSDEAQYFGVPDAITLDQLLVLAVVLDEHVQALADARREDPDRELSDREERTRDKLIATMAAEILQWKPGEKADFEGLTDLVDASKAYGIGFSYNTAKDHVWRAWERAKPKSLEGKPALPA